MADTLIEVSDANKAQAKVVLALARALDCSVEELLDTNERMNTKGDLP